MVNAEASVVIQRPVEEVFGVVQDVSKIPMWQSVMVEGRQLTDGPFGVGTKLVMSGSLLGKRFDIEAEIIEHEPNRSFVSKSTGGPLEMTSRLACEPVEGGTRFIQQVEGQAHGFFKVGYPVLTRVARRQLENSAATLKDLLEADAI